MDLTLFTGPGNFNERSIELFNESLVSSSPSLLPGTVEQIEAICDARLAQLDGAPRFHAAALFEALEKLPPLEAIRFEPALQRLIQTDFSWPAFVGVFTELFVRGEPAAGANEQSQHEVSEWGYLTGNAPVTPLPDRAEGLEPDFPKNIPVTLDLLKSGRKGVEFLAELKQNLFRIEESWLRKLLVEDCLNIIELRTRIYIPSAV